MATPKKDREAPSRNTNTTNGDGALRQRRGKNEPGHYRAPEDMDGELDGELNELLDEYDLDEGDGDVDWDSMPPRGGGKSPDK